MELLVSTVGSGAASGCSRKNVDLWAEVRNLRFQLDSPPGWLCDFE